MELTILADSEKRTEELQGVANKLAEEYNYSPHAIMHYLGLKKDVSVSLITENNQLIMKCYERRKIG